jgi:hypothetical protein
MHAKMAFNSNMQPHLVPWISAAPQAVLEFVLEPNLPALDLLHNDIFKLLLDSGRDGLCA